MTGISEVLLADSSAHRVESKLGRRADEGNGSRPGVAGCDMVAVDESDEEPKLLSLSR